MQSYFNPVSEYFLMLDLCLDFCVGQKQFLLVSKLPVVCSAPLELKGMCKILASKDYHKQLMS